MADELTDLIAACKAAPGSPGLLRVLLRLAREAADPEPVLAYLADAPGALSDDDARSEIADFLALHERHEAALAWAAGESAVLKVRQARALLALERRREAAALYSEAVRADPSLREADLDRQLAVVRSPVAGGADIIDLSGRRIDAGEPAPPPLPVRTPEKVVFADIGGLEDVKDQINRRIILPFKSPGLFEKFRRRAGGGIMLFGPPGCGKTMLARATAGECDARFISIRIPEILDMYIGESEKRLATVFREARESRPAVLFFDEVEAVAARRRYGPSAGQATLVSTFLTELDGMDASNDGVLILAATNVPWAIDSAFRRPGRFDRVLFVPPPDQAARLDIVRTHMRERPQEKALDLAEIAARTSGFSGADLAAVVEEAADLAIEDSIAAGGELRPISRKHLAAALKSRKSTTVEWLTMARNYAKYANEGGLYDEVVEFLDKHAK